MSTTTRTTASTTTSTKAQTPGYMKVSGDTSCIAEGFQDYVGTADGCVLAAESVGYDFDITRQQHAVPVIHEPEQTYKRVCIVCENMIYQGRPNLLFWDRPKDEQSCDQDGQQTKFHICQEKYV